MINILSSNAHAASRAFNEAQRKASETNIQWLERNMPSGDNQSILVMVGGRTQTSFRLRIAQSHVRHDLLPSYWSHVVLLGKPAKNLGSTKVYEISLEPPQGFGNPTPNNGVQEGRLARYEDASEYPNVAVIAVPVTLKEILSALERFKMQRAILDAVDLMVRWLAFAWGVSRSGNPLLDGAGVPSAAMLEIAIGAAGFDLTPGLESRSSCPEAIWQAAKWWHEYYEGQNKQGLSGSYFTPHKLE
jgi:hypothetical protein